MPSKTFKRKNVKSKNKNKNKKSIKRNSKLSSRSKKMRSNIRKMKGGEVITESTREYFNIKDTDVELKKDNYYINSENLYFCKNSKIFEFINFGFSFFNSYDDKEGINLFDTAFDEKDKLERDKLLNEVYTDRKTKIEKENLIKLPTGVFLRTPKWKNQNLYKKNELQFKLPFFTVKENFLYLYKAVSILQLKDIYEKGLNSKYGGIAGADIFEDIQEYDRGKMYIGKSILAATDYMEDIVLSVLIILKIPVEMSYDINLASDFSTYGSFYGSMGSYFVGSIPSKFIYIIVNDKEYLLNEKNITLAIQNVIENLTPEQIESFTPTIINSFTPEQKKLLNARKIKLDIYSFELNNLQI